MNEVWKEVKGTNKRYFVSNYGNVKSKYKTLTGFVNHNYLSVTIHYEVGTQKKVLVHRLVAEAFVPNPLNKTQVNHIDGNKFNNNADNLEWVTCQENIEHAYATCLHKNRKVIQTECGCIVKIYRSALKASKETHISYPSIHYCLKGRQKTAGGYGWTYADSLKGKRIIKENM